MVFNAKCEREAIPGWQIKYWDDANKLLSYLNPEGPSSVSFTIDSSSYIQGAGPKTRLTVEAIVVEPMGRFSHYVLERGNVQYHTNKRN
jgi:hypothetical protein